MDTELNQASIFIHSHPYSYQQFLRGWLFKDDDESPLILDIYQSDKYIRVVTEEWVLHLEQTDSEIEMTVQTIVGRTLFSDRRNRLLDSLVKTVDSYIASLPDKLEYIGVGFGFEFFIANKDNPKGWNHNFANSPQDFEKLFGNQYEFFGRIRWEHAEYKVQTTVELSEGDQSFVQPIISNYHRDIQSVGGIRAALPDFISVNDNAHKVTKQLLEKADG